MVVVLVYYICVCLKLLSYITGLYVLYKILFMMELIVGHTSRRIKFGLIMLMVGAYFVVWVMVSPTCSNYDPARLLAADDGQFPTYILVSRQKYHVTSGNYLP